MPIVTINSNNHNELDRWCPKFRIVVLDTISYYVEISRLKTCDSKELICLNLGVSLSIHMVSQHGSSPDLL